MGAFSFIGDQLVNVLAGLGGTRDKSSSNSWRFEELTREQLSNAYRGDGLSRKVIDAPAFDMVREWRAWQAEKDQIEAIEKEEGRLNLRAKVKKAQNLARLYGGAGLVLGVGADDPTEPLTAERVGKDALRWAHVMHRYRLTAGELRTDPEDEWCGEPVWYEFTTTAGKSHRVHPSRVVRFLGNEHPDEDMNPHGWGDSVLQSVNESLQNASAAISGIASLVLEAKVDIYKIPRLSENIASKEYSDLLVKRFQTSDSIKSIINGIILDAEEEHDQKQISFSNLPEIIREYLQIVSGVSDIPATRLLGQAPGGLNSDGESALRNYYDRIRAEQTLTVGPALSRLDEVLIRSATGQRDDDVHALWNPLYQLDEKEQMEVEKGRSETFGKYASMGLVPSGVLAKAVENALIESGRFPGIEAAYEEFGEETEEFDPEAGDPNNPDPDAPDDLDPEDDPTQAADAAPRTLYVYRKVLNTADILRWAKDQGFKSPMPGSELHVTITYSKTPVDWLKMGQSWGDEDGGLTIAPGGARLVDRFGDATVLLFAASELSWRHEHMKHMGASWDHEEYQPHITISWNDTDIDLKDIEPYRGKIELGPEVFEEIDTGWSPEQMKDRSPQPRDARGRFIKRS
ncbi:DUF1073 domain-containing protein [Henriciella mobilis]|uniref:anti-CBASS protein Acb1 family protein n=1 Tax=Henriciella mobilis TaxID=2305467 RepID=UPI000E661AB7|nr:anti-CBASS Acb1 family protein [Henriciella mobilis]RIJ15965.1 DUF1073 domain-containing protein [Henriciella mobilis]RIJ21175.1 DUF1073 domain-containing protein [Henriciella mobilis]RIJ23124.1 DUF1073 domain-containing protein [Henriciella mobilis]